jgi:transcription initiation factor IIE alpha subunit
MAVPKRKTSKARRDKRRANWKLSIPGFVACPKCGADLNQGDCGCDNEEIDPRWEKLKNFK